ncbi:MAG: FAD-dependent oxidoreductase [Candidatus Sedimenticola sp. 6PFRAG1]
MMKPVVIIGTGMAGYSLAREFRQLDKKTPLLMITGDDGRSYPKPMLSSAYQQGKEADDLALASSETMSKNLDAEILTHTRVESIHAQVRQVIVNGRAIDYRELVLAVGAQPIRLPLKGTGAADVLSVNNLQDYAEFRRLAVNARRVAIIGPGLIGCEFANDLLSAGKQVTVIGPDPYPISTLLPEQAGRALQSALQARGVEWQLQTVTGTIDRSGNAYSITLENGETVETDLVLSAVGLRPDISLAEAAGLAVNRGIVTDATLKSSVDGIYALGDCAEVEGRNLPFVMPLMLGAKTLARTLAGDPTEVAYPAMPVVIKTTLHPVVVSPPGSREGEWQVEQLEDGVKARFVSSTGELLGYALTGSAVDQKQALTRELDIG